VRNWVRQIDLHANQNVEKILVGNKCDLENKKVIDTQQGQELATEFGMSFYELVLKLVSISVKHSSMLLNKLKKSWQNNSKMEHNNNK